jgi:WD40 repeat protein
MDGGNRINSVTFSADGKLLAAGVYDTGIRLWDVATQKPLGEPVREMDPDASDEVMVSFSPRQPILAVASATSVRLWDLSRLGLKQLRRAIDGRTNVHLSLEGDVEFR